MQISFNTDNMLERIKDITENFLYTFGIKVHFSRPTIEFLKQTTDLKTQFQNLITYYQKLQEAHEYYQKIEWKGRFSDKQFPPPSIELIPVNETGLKHYQMIWNNYSGDRYVRVFYREDGTLCWVQASRLPMSKESSGAGVSFLDICLIWELYSKT